MYTYVIVLRIKVQILEDLFYNNVTKIMPLSIGEVKKLIASFKNGKSPDCFNLCAEHLKYAGGESLVLVTNIINFMLDSKIIPDDLLKGILIAREPNTI